MTSILRLNLSGTPTGWISREEAAVLYTKNMIAWEYGKAEQLMRGGRQNDGKQSSLNISSIIAIRGRSWTESRVYSAFSNRMLFRRDGYRCMYCGLILSCSELTRDHIVPTSRGGEDRWENVVAACKRCNHQKADKMLDDIDMNLLAIPFRPNIFESMFLAQHTIREDQMEYLEKRFSGRRTWTAA